MNNASVYDDPFMLRPIFAKIPAVNVCVALVAATRAMLMNKVVLNLNPNISSVTYCEN